MVSFFIALALLLFGFAVYGRFAEKIFGPDDRETPAIAINDGVDCIPMPTWKAFLIQFLNIAGTGPIFGALMGAVFGPVVLLWIVFGSILGGAVHDYMTGMISCRHEGRSIADLSGNYLGKPIMFIMRILSLVLMILTGAVFITSPAALLAGLTPGIMGQNVWAIIILLYYILATILPIDKVIGKLYPVFGVILILMAVCISGGILVKGYTIPEFTLKDLHPDGLPVFPFMCITVACGAVSGFHATQSPMIAKCIKSEHVGRKVFYGAMICESVIALVWATAGAAFYGSTGSLSEAISGLGQSGVVYEISGKLLGTVGGVFAVIGVVVAPITTGDTAFRSARLILAEWTGFDQKSIAKRLFLTIPLLGTGFLLTLIDLTVIWRYFSWSNQTLAMISLWVVTAYLIKNCKYRFGSLLTALPAAFMSAVSLTYILMAKEGLSLNGMISYTCGILFAVALFIVYAVALGKTLKARKTAKL